MTEPLRVFLGYDRRQPLAYTVLQHSIIANSSKPVAITPLVYEQLPIKRRGLTDFTFSRYLVPWLCQFKGRAVFMDSDIVVSGDIAELFEMESMSAVSVMQDQDRFEWPSVMLFQCSACLRLTPEFVNDERSRLNDLNWAPSVGKLPTEWNYCIGYQEPKEAKLYHYTQGIPCWYETQELEDEHWNKAREAALHTVPWRDLMRTSVHAKPTLSRLLTRLGVE